MENESSLCNKASLWVFFLSLFIYFEMESTHKQGSGRERGRDRILIRLYTVSEEPIVGLELMNYEIMTRAEVGC